MSSSKARQEISELPLGEVRQLLSLRKNLPQLKTLLTRRDEHLLKAKQIEEQISFMISGEFTKLKDREGTVSVKKMCIEVLKKCKRGLTTTEIKNRISKYFPDNKIKNLYNTTYVTLNKYPDFKRLKNKTFVLKARR